MRKIRKSIVALIFVSLIGCGAAFADPMTNTKSVGLSLNGDLSGKFTGGLNYQMWLTEKLGIGFEGFGLYVSNGEYRNPFLWYNFCTEIDYKIAEASDGRMTGNRCYLWTKMGVYGSSNGLSEENFKSYADFIGGVGFTVDLYLWNHVCLPISFGGMVAVPTEPSFCLSIGSGLKFSF